MCICMHCVICMRIRLVYMRTLKLHWSQCSCCFRQMYTQCFLLKSHMRKQPLSSMCICVFISLALTEVGHANLRRNPYGSCPAVVPLGSMSQKFVKDKVVNRRTNATQLSGKIKACLYLIYSLIYFAALKKKNSA